jgi:hypothetical protein
MSEPMERALIPARVKELLLRTWGEQACQNPDNWPPTVRELMARSIKQTNGSYRLRVAEACEAIASAFANGCPADADDVVWRAFLMLDQDHRTQLIRRLKADLVVAKLEERA